LQDKEVNRFGVGLAKMAYPYLRLVGSKDSVGIRGDGRIFVNDVEEKTGGSILSGFGVLSTSGEKST